MVQNFKIVKITTHHNRGQFIFARHSDELICILVKDGATLNGIPIFHYTNIAVDKGLYTFRPLDLQGFPDGHFQEGQIVELID